MYEWSQNQESETMNSSHSEPNLSSVASAIANDDRITALEHVDLFLSETQIDAHTIQPWIFRAWSCNSISESIEALNRVLDEEPGNEVAVAGLTWLRGVRKEAETHLETVRLEAERLEAERLEAERLEAERLEAERLEAERLEAERLEAERLEAERLEAERLEAERLEAERLEAERLEAERLEAERLEAKRLEAEQLEAERLEAERLEAQRLEAESLEAERLEAERLEAERLEAEQLEADRLKAEQFEAEQLEAEQLEAEQLEAERLEAEQLEVEQQPEHHSSQETGDLVADENTSVVSEESEIEVVQLFDETELNADDNEPTVSEEDQSEQATPEQDVAPAGLASVDTVSFSEFEASQQELKATEKSEVTETETSAVETEAPANEETAKAEEVVTDEVAAELTPVATESETPVEAAENADVVEVTDTPVLETPVDLEVVSETNDVTEMNAVELEAPAEQFGPELKVASAEEQSSEAMVAKVVDDPAVVEGQPQPQAETTESSELEVVNVEPVVVEPVADFELIADDVVEPMAEVAEVSAQEVVAPPEYTQPVEAEVVHAELEVVDVEAEVVGAEFVEVEADEFGVNELVNENSVADELAAFDLLDFENQTLDADHLEVERMVSEQIDPAKIAAELRAQSNEAASLPFDQPTMDQFTPELTAQPVQPEAQPEAKLVEETPIIEEVVGNQSKTIEDLPFDVPTEEPVVLQQPAEQAEAMPEPTVAADETVEDVAEETLVVEPETTEEKLHSEVTQLASEVRDQLESAEATANTSRTLDCAPMITTESGESRKPVILSVDDSATIRKLVSLTLREKGYEVMSANDGVEALNILAERLPDLILSDINMPKLGGYKLCKFVKKHERTASIPVIMLSGRDGVFDKMRGKMTGCDGFIVKPFDAEELLSTVREHLSKIETPKN